MNFPYFDLDDGLEPPSEAGVSLTVAYLPGLKVDIVPLLESEQVLVLIEEISLLCI